MFWLAMACSGTVPSTTVSTTGHSESTGPEATCEPMLREDGSPSGFQYCWTTDRHHGRIDLAVEVPCTHAFPDPAVGNCADETCSANADCGPDALCIYADPTGYACTCLQLCITDGDCGASATCACDGTWSDRWFAVRSTGADTCIDADCSQNSDCPAGACGFSRKECGAEAHCRSPADTCRFDSDCNGACRWDPDARHYACLMPALCNE